MKYASSVKGILLCCLLAFATPVSATMVTYDLTFNPTGIFFSGGSGRLAFDDEPDGIQDSPNRPLFGANVYNFDIISGDSVWGKWHEAFFYYGPDTGEGFFGLTVAKDFPFNFVFGVQVAPQTDPLTALETLFALEPFRQQLIVTRATESVPEVGATLPLLLLGMAALGAVRRLG